MSGYIILVPQEVVPNSHIMAKLAIGSLVLMAVFIVGDAQHRRNFWHVETESSRSGSNPLHNGNVSDTQPRGSHRHTVQSLPVQPGDDPPESSESSYDPGSAYYSSSHRPYVQHETAPRGPGDIRQEIRIAQGREPLRRVPSEDSVEGPRRDSPPPE